MDAIKCPRCGSAKVFTPDGFSFKGEYGQPEVSVSDLTTRPWMDSHVVLSAAVTRIDLCGECGFLIPVVGDVAKLHALHEKNRAARKADPGRSDREANR